MDGCAARRATSASREAAIRWSGDTGMPAAAQGVGGVDEEPRHALRAGMAEHVVVPTGADDAGAVPRRPAQAAMRPGHPRDGDLDLRLPAQHGGIASVRRRRRVEGGDVPRTAHDGHHPVVAEAGPRRAGACAPRGRASDRSVTVPARTAAIASPTASNTVSPSPRCSTRSSHQRSASGSPAAAASAPSGSGGAVAPWTSAGSGATRSARLIARGRSIASTATPLASAQRTACHSGLNVGERREDGTLGPGDHVARAARPAARGRRHRSIGAPRRRRQAPRPARRRVAARRGHGPPSAPSRDRGGGCPAGAVAAPAAAGPRRPVRRGRDRRRRSRPSRRDHGPPPRGTRATRRRRAAGRARRPRRCRRRCRRAAACRRRSGRRGPGRS